MLAVAAKRKIKVIPWTVHIVLVLLQAMQFGDTRTIFNELIPSDPYCQQKGEHGCLCNSHIDCNRTNFLECIDGLCACMEGNHRKFDPSLQMCMSLPGTYCGSGLPRCISNAVCDLGRCTCREGYSRTMRNNCSLNFGEECGPLLCNSESGLACKEGVCMCFDSSFVYSAIHGVCIDPEAVARQIFQQLTQRIIQGIFNFKVRRAMNAIMLPFRFVTRLALGPFG